MKDHRYVDELSIEELEEALRLRRSQERVRRMRMQGRGERPDASDPLRKPPPSVAAPGTPARALPAGANRYSARVEQASGRARRPVTRRAVKWRWIVDQFLLFIELLALGGFLLLVAQMVLSVREINEESRALQAQPTPTATPMISAYVLPGVHTPPDAQSQSEPVPVPAHLRDMVSVITPLPVPTPGPEQGVRIVIPAIEVDAPIVEGDDWEALKKGVGHTIWSANPGERGNCVLSAHNDIYGEIFRYLPDLKVGDEVLVYTQSQSFRYVIEQTRIIEHTEVSVMANTSTPVLTLISCYPYGIDSHSIVAIASLQPK